MDEFTTAYIACALWSSRDEATPDGGEPMDANYSADDLAPETLASIKADCAKFQSDNARLFGYDYACAGHDFWLTRNGHGAGFWDGSWPEHGDALTTACKAYGEVDLYVGDDGKIYS